MKAHDLIKTLRDELEITTCIQSLIYDNFCSLDDQERRAMNRKKEMKLWYEEAQNASGLIKSQVENEENFDSPLHRIKVFNQIKKVLLRMTRVNGMISLRLLDGILQDLRN